MRFLENQTEKTCIFTNNKITIYYKVYFHILSSGLHYIGY